MAEDTADNYWIFKVADCKYVVKNVQKQNNGFNIEEDSAYNAVIRLKTDFRGICKKLKSKSQERVQVSSYGCLINDLVCQAYRT